MLAQHISMLTTQCDEIRMNSCFVVSTRLEHDAASDEVQCDERSEYEKFEETKYELRAIHRVKSRVYMGKCTLCIVTI